MSKTDEIGLVLAKTILASEGDLSATEALALVDALRSICNSGFSEAAIRSGLEHPRFKVRKYVESFLAETSVIVAKKKASGGCAGALVVLATVLAAGACLIAR